MHSSGRRDGARARALPISARRIDLLVRPEGIQTLVDLSNRTTPLAKEIHDARLNATGMAWFADDVMEAEPPRESDFGTETAAEIFADIVDENLDTVKKSFTGLIGKGRLAVAFSNAEKDDVNHQHDGHKKVRTNKL